MAGEVRFQPTIEDHVAGQRLFLSRILPGRRMKILVAGLLLVELAAVAGVAYDLATGDSLRSSLSDKAVPLLAPLAIVAVAAWNWLRVPGVVRRMADQQPTLLSETEWRWDDRMLIAESAAGTSRIEWASLYRWLADSRSVLAFPQQGIALILPRHALSPDQATDLLVTMTQFAVKARRT